MSEPRLRYAVIPIAGFGTRMFPASKAVPKALLPIVHRGFAKPILHVIIEEALSAGVEKICLVCSPSQIEEVKEYFSSEPLDVYQKKFPEQCRQLRDISSRIAFAIQPEMKGFGDAVLCSRDVVGTEHHVLVMLGDHVYTSSDAQGRSCAKQLVDAWTSCGKVGSATSLDTCALQDVRVNGIVNVSPVPTADPDVGARAEADAEAGAGAGADAAFTGAGVGVFRVDSGVEKPSVEYAKNNLTPCGFQNKDGSTEPLFYCYFGMDLLSPLIFEELQSMKDDPSLRTHGELQLRDAMMRVADREQFLGVRVQGKRHDTGMPCEYAQAIAAMAAVPY
eukprot:ANDGO_04453.mRNA.1 Putative UTP--glucose-1-phosphate uridylyltransferase